IPRNVRRSIEAFTGWSRAGKRRSAAATTTLTSLTTTAATTATAGLRDRLYDGDSRRKRIEPRSGHVHRFRFAAEDHLHTAVPVELDDLGRHLIDDPNVVLRIDAHLLGLQKPIRALSDPTHSL